jgi:hypothetical protein
MAVQTWWAIAAFILDRVVSPACGHIFIKSRLQGQFSGLDLSILKPAMRKLARRRPATVSECPLSGYREIFNDIPFWLAD